MVHIVRGKYTIMICMVLFNVHSRVSRKLYFLVLVLVIYSFTNVFPKQPATCTRCPSSWADRVWCACRRASCCVLMSGRGRPGGPPGQGTPEGNGGWFPGRHTRRSLRKRVCHRDGAGG